MNGYCCTDQCTCYKPGRLEPTSSYRPSFVAKQAQTERPQGSIGTYAMRSGSTSDAILDRDGMVWIHAHTGSMVDWLWVPMRGADVDHFESDPDVPEWVLDCPHTPVCYDGRDETNQAACVALRREHDTERWADR